MRRPKAKVRLPRTGRTARVGRQASAARAEAGKGKKKGVGRIDEAGRGSFASAKLSAGGRSGRQSSVGKIAFCGCGRDVEACAAFRGCSVGQASSDFFCGAWAVSRMAFRERVFGRRVSAASFCGAQRAISGSGVEQKRSFFPSRKSSPVNDNEILFL